MTAHIIYGVPKEGSPPLVPRAPHLTTLPIYGSVQLSMHVTSASGLEADTQHPLSPSLLPLHVTSSRWGPLCLSVPWRAPRTGGRPSPTCWTCSLQCRARGLSHPD